MMPAEKISDDCNVDEWLYSNTKTWNPEINSDGRIFTIPCKSDFQVELTIDELLKFPTTLFISFGS